MVYATLRYRNSTSEWKSVSAMYTTTALPPPAIDSPANASTLADVNQTFSWITNGNFVSDWWLQLGTTAGANDLFDSGVLDGSTSSVTVDNLPTDSSTIHATLHFRNGAFMWKNMQFTYTAATPPNIVDPAAQLESENPTYTWTANGLSITEWWIYLGSADGGRDLFNSGSLPNTTN